MKKMQWAVFFRPCLCMLAVLFALSSCDTETIDFGSINNVDAVLPGSDWIDTETGRYQAYTRSIALDAVRANSHKCYFGQVTDASTGSIIRAEYAAQLHCFEGSIFPSLKNFVSKDGDSPVCDSVEVIMYYDSWYGDENAPLKVSATPLSRSELLPEDSVFFTDVNLDKFSAGNTPIGSSVFTIMDRSYSNSELSSDTHAHCARIRLPKSFGDDIVAKYYENRNLFTDSYAFTTNVCPGFRMNLVSGDGALVAVNATSLNIYYRYRYRENGKDTIAGGTTTFVGSAEVVQATRFEIGGLEAMLSDHTCTYVSSPSGVATEVELPVLDIMRGHENDSLARVQLTMMRHKSTLTTKQGAFSAPATLGMVLKEELKTFFEPGYTLNARKFATSSYSNMYNCYDFNNIARMVSYMHKRKMAGMIAEGLDEDSWMQSHPDWNRVVLVPVSVITNSSANTVVSVLNDMSITNARLVGGDTPINVNVIYSKYK